MLCSKNSNSLFGLCSHFNKFLLTSNIFYLKKDKNIPENSTALLLLFMSFCGDNFILSMN